MTSVDWGGDVYCLLTATDSDGEARVRTQSTVFVSTVFIHGQPQLTDVQTGLNACKIANAGEMVSKI